MFYSYYNQGSKSDVTGSVGYIASDYFGYNVDFDAFVAEIIHTFKPSLNYILNKQILIELYETKYKICDHLTASNPLASVTMHESEKYMAGFLYESWLRTYLYRDIGSKLHMSFDQFIDRPRDAIETIVRIVDEIETKKNKANERFLNDVQKEKVNVPDSLKDI